MKKAYDTPEMEILILEQSDIITTSGNASGSPETGGGGNTGAMDRWE